MKGALIQLLGGRCQICETNNLDLLTIRYKDFDDTNHDADNLEVVCVNCVPDNIPASQYVELEKISFDSIMARSGQITVKKRVRDALKIDPKDIIFLRINKVLSPLGATKFSIGE